MRFVLCSALISFLFVSTSEGAKPRARDLGIPFDGKPGKWNAITDVPGVEVGHVSVVSGRGVKGEMHTARTGVTLVFPLGRNAYEGVPGAWAALNANGDVTGVSWLEESGMLEGPVGMTNTQSLGLVRDSLAEWVHEKYHTNDEGLLPIVGETDDSWLNDLYSFHVKKSHVFKAAENAKSGPVPEGSVGAGTGTVAYGFKAGIGTASRIVKDSYHLGVLVQANYGQRQDLRIAGIPIGKQLLNELLPVENPAPRRDGSIVVVLATDAPLLPHQLKRVVKRVALGMARNGSLGRNTSGEFFVGFSTSRPIKSADGIQTWKSLSNNQLDLFFEAAIQVTEEAIINSLVAAEDSRGINGSQYLALPHARLKSLLAKYHRLESSKPFGR